MERTTYLLDAVRGRSMLSIGLGGYAEERGYSYSLASTDPRQTVSGRLATAARTATFADLSEDAIDAFRPRVEATFHLIDVTTPPATWPPGLRGRTFEIVVVGEVLEHLDNPGAALRALHGAVAEGGRLIITVPNAFSLASMVRIVAGRETTHPEHTAHYSYVTLRRLLAMNGLSGDLLWYRWGRHGGSPVDRAKRSLAAGLCRLLPQVSHGLIAVVDG